MRALEAVTFAPLFRWINLYRQNEDSVLGKMDWKEEVQMDATWIFKGPYARSWWEYSNAGLLKSGYLSKELFDLVEEEINDPQSVGPEEFYDNIQETLVQNIEEDSKQKINE
ncbi:MAG: hypothetical protein P8L44_11810 [Opitutales bacterium]|nr:hypothetical protein [Opitutales bacterium]